MSEELENKRLLIGTPVGISLKLKEDLNNALIKLDKYEDEAIKDGWLDFNMFYPTQIVMEFGAFKLDVMYKVFDLPTEYQDIFFKIASHIKLGSLNKKEKEYANHSFSRYKNNNYRKMSEKLGLDIVYCK
jgi:hypothetical protein